MKTNVQPSLPCAERKPTRNSEQTNSSPRAPLVHQFRLVLHEGEHPAHIVGNAERQQSNDKDQEQHPPEAQILDKLLPCGSEAGQDSFPLLQVGVEEGMAFHGTFTLSCLHGLQF